MICTLQKHFTIYTTVHVCHLSWFCLLVQLQMEKSWKMKNQDHIFCLNYPVLLLFIFYEHPNSYLSSDFHVWTENEMEYQWCLSIQICFFYVKEKYIYIYVSLAGYMDMLCNYQNCYVLTIIVLTHQRMHMIWSKVYFWSSIVCHTFGYNFWEPHAHMSRVHTNHTQNTPHAVTHTHSLSGPLSAFLLLFLYFREPDK